MKSFKEFINEDGDYRSNHRAPSKKDGAPLHDVSSNEIYPSNVYSDKAVHLYGVGDSVNDRAVINKIHSLRNKPESMVDVYRAVPKDAPDKINHGDWVTIHKPYAHQHGKSVLNNNYKIIHEKHPAKHLYTDANSIYEFGLDKR